MKPKKLGILLLLLISTLTNAQTQLWDSINEGKWEITHYHKTGNIIVMAMVVENATKQVVVDKKARSEPLFFWDLAGDTFLNMQSNWKGGPTQMNPSRVWIHDSSRLFISDGIKIIRADIDFKKNNVNYSQTFQGNEDTNVIEAFFKGRNNTYFTSSYGKNFVYVCDMLGNIEKTIPIDTSALLSITSIIEWKDSIYFGYTYVGGLADGSGFAKLDPLTGQITKIYGQPWNFNANGCYISIVGGRFYLETDPGLYNFEPSLFEFKNGSWNTKVVGARLPKELDLYWGIHEWHILVRDNGHYPNGDTINKTSGGADYKFNVITGEIGSMIPKDSRLDIQFSEDFKTAFSQRHAQNMPEISFIYEAKGKVIGFGPNIVAQLKDLSSGMKNPKLSDLNVYPNPATGDNLYIQGLQKPTEYIITNTTGQTVSTGYTYCEIDLSAVKPGVYLLTLPASGAYARWVKSW